MISKGCIFYLDLCHCFEAVYVYYMSSFLLSRITFIFLIFPLWFYHDKSFILLLSGFYAGVKLVCETLQT